MDWPGRGGVVIPCHNEAAAIESVVRGVRSVVPWARIIVVDDASTDDTGRRATRAGAEVVRLALNAGKGAALGRGLAHAAAEGWDWAILMDGDGQHAAEDIPGFLAVAESTGADLVLGNRMHQAASIPWLRRWVNRWMSRDLSRVLGVDIPDSQCGFRLVRLGAWARALPEGGGFLIESDMLARFRAESLTLAMAPVRVLPRVHGRSRIRVWRDTMRWWRWRRGLGRRLRFTPGDASGG